MQFQFPVQQDQIEGNSKRIFKIELASDQLQRIGVHSLPVRLTRIPFSIKKFEDLVKVCKYMLEDQSKAKNCKTPLFELSQKVSIVKSIFRKLLGNYEKKLKPKVLDKIKKNLEKNRRKLEPFLNTNNEHWDMKKIERLMYKYVSRGFRYCRERGIYH